MYLRGESFSTVKREAARRKRARGVRGVRGSGSLRERVVDKQR